MKYLHILLLCFAILGTGVKCTRTSDELDPDLVQDARDNDQQEEDEQNLGNFEEQSDPSFFSSWWRHKSCKCKDKNPCENAKCPKHPSAKCKFYTHGRRCCKPIWYDEKTKIRVSCKCKGRIYQCAKDPCDGAVCPKHPRATCVSNYCLGCNADFYSYSQQLKFAWKVRSCAVKDDFSEDLMQGQATSDNLANEQSQDMAEQQNGMAVQDNSMDDKIAPRMDGFPEDYMQPKGVNDDLQDEPRQDMVEQRSDINENDEIVDDSLDHMQPRSDENADSDEGEQVMDVDNGDTVEDPQDVMSENDQEDDDDDPQDEADENDQEYDSIDDQADPKAKKAQCKNTCPKYPSAKCRRRLHRCCKWYYGGIRLNCDCGTTVVQCAKNPCDGATCPRYPKAVCVSNYCGGCNADFFVKYGPWSWKVKSCAICPKISCTLNCLYGRKYDDNRCPICKCNDKPDKVCYLPKNLKSCQARRNWYYDVSKRKCVPSPKKCNNNANNFKSKKACEKVCPRGV